jgi:AraC family transcriptional regulator
MVLREMPNLADSRFRSWFYQRWGHENCIIAANTRRAEFPDFRQTLSIKLAWGGQEDYFLDGARVVVDDDTFVILNEGRTYSSRLISATPVTSFSIFFRPGMAQEVERSLTLDHGALLDDPEPGLMVPVEFSERVHRHDASVSPVLKFIYRHVAEGVQDEVWYEEQLHFLLQRMLRLHLEDRKLQGQVLAARPGTRRELFRRVGLGVNFIIAHYAQPIGLREIAAACRLSPHHCLRVFKSVYGKTPAAFLRERRLQVAERLLRDSDAAIDAVAEMVGFQCRSTLFRHIKQLRGLAPSMTRSIR